MKIVHINTFMNIGGAAQAVVKLNDALNRMSVESKVLTKDSFECLLENSPTNLKIYKDFQECCIPKYRTKKTNTFFTSSYPSIDISEHEYIKEADVINLHWTSFFQSPLDIRAIYNAGKTILFTLHDERMYTGGCHYSAGCNQFETGCKNCPQVQRKLWDLVHLDYLDREKILGQMDVDIVCSSGSHAKRIRKSQLFKGKRIHIQPCLIEPAAYAVEDKSIAKSKLGLSKDSKLILFCAYSAQEKRKGFRFYISALKSLKDEEEFREDISNGNLIFGVLGNNSETDPNMVNFGFVDHVEEKIAIYNAADLLLFTSLEDTFGQVITESMACGTPVIAFDTGCAKDFIQNGVNGYIVGKKVSDLVSAIKFHFFRKERDNAGIHARSKIENIFSDDKQIHNYLEIIKKAKKKQNKRVRINDSHSLLQEYLLDEGRGKKILDDMVKDHVA